MRLLLWVVSILQLLCMWTPSVMWVMFMTLAGKKDLLTSSSQQMTGYELLIVYIHFELNMSSGIPVSTGDMFRDQYMWWVYRRWWLISTVWLVYSREQVFTSLSVSEQLSVREMGPGSWPVYHYHCHSISVCTDLTHCCEYYTVTVSEFHFSIL